MPFRSKKKVPMMSKIGDPLTINKPATLHTPQAAQNNIPVHSHGANMIYGSGAVGNASGYSVTANTSPPSKYPQPLGIWDQMQDLPNYINAMVDDVQQMKSAVEGALDRLEALMERIELLEDDLAN